MQPESKIRHRLKLLRFRYLEKKIRKATSRNPENCLYNVRRDSDGPIPVRYCTNANPGFCGAVCDPNYNGKEIAARCTQFESRYSPEIIKQEFFEFLQTATSEELARSFPDIMALLWVLGEQVTRNFGDEDIAPLEITEGEVKLAVPEAEFITLQTDSEIALPYVEPLVLMYRLPTEVSE